MLLVFCFCLYLLVLLNQIELFVIFKIKFYSLIVAFCFWENELIFRMSDCYFERGIRQVLPFYKSCIDLTMLFYVYCKYRGKSCGI